MQLIQFFFFSFFTSFLMSPSHLFFGLPCGHTDIGFHLYTFFTILSSSTRCKCPNQLNPCAFTWFIIFLCLIDPSNLSFVSILHVPSLSFVGPKIFLNIFLSNTINLFFTVSFTTHTSQAYVTMGLIILQYSFNFWFLGDQSTFKEKLICIICFISKCYSILGLFFYWVITIYSWSQIFIFVVLIVYNFSWSILGILFSDHSQLAHIVPIFILVSGMCLIRTV